MAIHRTGNTRSNKATALLIILVSALPVWAAAYYVGQTS